MPRAVKRGVEREIPAADLLIYDGTDFPSPCVRRIRGALVADFVRQADPNRPVPLFGDAESRTNVVANPLPTLPRLDTSEHIKSRLKPVIESLRNFESFVLGMIRRQHAINNGLAAV